MSNYFIEASGWLIYNLKTRIWVLGIFDMFSMMGGIHKHGKLLVEKCSSLRFLQDVLDQVFEQDNFKCLLSRSKHTNGQNGPFSLN